MEKMLTIKDVTRKYGLSASAQSERRAGYNGRRKDVSPLPYTKKGKRVLYRKDDVEKALSACPPKNSKNNRPGKWEKKAAPSGLQTILHGEIYRRVDEILKADPELREMVSCYVTLFGPAGLGF